MSTEVFELHIQQALEKLEDLWQRSNAIPTTQSQLQPNEQALLSQQQQALLEESLDQLSASIEELQLASETLRQQNDELLASRQQIAAERQYYLDLFKSTPNCYIITSKDGTIEEVNQKTTELLGVAAKYLQRKSLAVFFEQKERQKYYTKLNQIKRSEISEASWQIQIITRQKQVIPAKCNVIAMRDSQGEIINLRWHIFILDIKPERDIVISESGERLTDLSNILIDNLRYPLYDLVTQMAEIKTEIGDRVDRIPADRRWQRMSRQICLLKNTVNNAHIFQNLQESTDLNLSLVDYTAFVRKTVRQVRQNLNPRQRITENYSKHYVGICDVLLLEQILINILSKSIEYTAVDSEIEIELTQGSFKHFIIQVKYLTAKTTTEDLLAVFSPLMGQERIKLVCDRDLTLGAIAKSVSLLNGEIKLKSTNNKANIIIELPLIS